MDRFTLPGRQESDYRLPKPKPKRRRRLSRHALQGLLSGAARQRDSLPQDSPRAKPTLPQLKFMERAE